MPQISRRHFYLFAQGKMPAHDDIAEPGAGRGGCNFPWYLPIQLAAALASSAGSASGSAKRSATDANKADVGF